MQYLDGMGSRCAEARGDAVVSYSKVYEEVFALVGSAQTLSGVFIYGKTLALHNLHHHKYMSNTFYCCALASV